MNEPAPEEQKPVRDAEKSTEETAAEKAAAKKKAGKKAAGKAEKKAARKPTRKTAGKAATKKAARKVAEASTRPAPTEEEIRRRAYEIYQRRGGEHGFDESDWHRAEEELREERARGEGGE